MNSVRFLFIEAAYYTAQGFKHSPTGTTRMYLWDAGAFSKVAIEQGLDFVLWLVFVLFESTAFDLAA